MRGNAPNFHWKTQLGSANEPYRNPGPEFFVEFNAISDANGRNRMSAKGGKSEARMLATETAFFDRNRESFAERYPGRYLLIRGESLVGHFDTFEAAVDEGARRFGRGPFLARRVGEDAPTLSAPALTLGLPLSCQ